MDERTRSLERFDEQHGVEPLVQISNFDIPFWDLVSFMVKSYVAFLIASAIIGVVVGVIFFAFGMLT